MITIRHYIANDYPMVAAWWKDWGENRFSPTMLPAESTFIAEIDSVPVSCVCLFLTNCNELSYLGNFISNPSAKGASKQEANRELLKFVKQFATDSGYNHVLAFAKEDKLKTHFETLGMRKTLENLDSFVVGE